MNVSMVRTRCAVLASAAMALVGCIVIGVSPMAAQAATKGLNLVSPSGASSADFGGEVLVLTNGNYAVVDAFYDFNANVDAGAVYLYNGETNALISTVTGSRADDQIGIDGLTEVGSSDFVILSASWHNGGLSSTLGAATWVNGTTGLNGQVNTGNSLVGARADDLAGAKVTTLVGGNYVVSSPGWDNGPITDAGAVTWANGNTGLTGQKIEPANSLVGLTASDQVGSGGVTALTDSDYVVSSPWWDGNSPDVGAVTRIHGAVSNTAVSTNNSLVGTTANDQVGSGGVTALTDSNYVVSSPLWDGDAADVGAVTWANGSLTTSDTVSTNNSLVGTTVSDQVGSDGVTALTNGNYVVSSSLWDNGVVVDAGAATWANGPVTHVAVSAENSLVGTTGLDNIASGGATALTNGNYVVVSPFWNGAISEAGAITWADGTTGLSGPVTTGNSLVGGSTQDWIGVDGVTALLNGDYVVSSADWDSVTAADVGAVTWADGSIATSDTVTAANSLIGTTPDNPTGIGLADHVGSGGVTALTDNNYVVSSPIWNGNALEIGAVTWADGSGLTSGVVSTLNSLVGTTDVDNVGSHGVMALTNANVAGTYVVISDLWDKAATEGNFDAGAATYGPAGGVRGTINASNSVLGTPGANLLGLVLSASDRVTTDNTIVIATAQNRVLLLQLDDLQDPVLSVMPEDKFDSAAQGSATKAVTFTPPTATDNRGIATVVCAPASGSLFPIGTTKVTCTATDTSGLTALNHFFVTVTDDEKPVLGTHSNIAVTVRPGVAAEFVTFDAPTATDNSGIQPSVDCLPASGSPFPVGVTTVHCDASDLAGNPADTKTFTVTVTTDTQPPKIDVPANMTASAAPGAANKAVTFPAPTATDNIGIQSIVCDPASGSLFPIGVTTVTCIATDVSGMADSDQFTVTVNATSVTPPTTTPTTPTAASDYVALSGARLVDTRPGSPTSDSQFAGQGIRNAGTTLQLTVAGRGGVTTDAAAVALNVTAVGATGNGFVTVFPCGSTQPTASNLNYTVGSVVPNAVITKIGTGGDVCVFVSAATHLVVDVNGYFPPSTSMQSLNPARLLETRDGLSTVDAQQQGVGVLAGGSVTAVQVTGRATVPTDASAAVLNVTVTEAQGPGFVTVYPCGTAIPTASNINYIAGSTVANMVVSKIGVGGTVCVFTNQGTHLVVDVDGYFPLVTSYQSLNPARLLDTRPGEATIDSQFLGAGLREAGEVTELTVTNRGGLPTNAGTVVLNVTVTGPTAAGFVTIYPCGIATPLASNLNYGAGSTVANAVVAKVGSDGKVCLFNSSRTHIVVDVNGFFPA